jgi:nucleoside-diphosphate-sugar epimerase
VSVLVTGGSGFIGRHLVARLPDAIAPSRAELDLSKPLSALPERVETVVHLAQSSRYREFPVGVDDVVAINVTAAAALADYARRAGARRFVLVSTGGVYGFGARPAREDDRVRPIGFYQASKYAAEVLLAPYAEYFATVILRPFFVYGPTQRGMLVASLARRVLRGQRVTGPGPSMNPIHVDDAVRAIEAALTVKESAVINVAGDEIVTVADIARGLAAAAGVEVVIEDGEPAGDLVADTSRMRELLGVMPQVSLADGLRGVIEEVRAAGR